MPENSNARSKLIPTQIVEPKGHISKHPLQWQCARSCNSKLVLQQQQKNFAKLSPEQRLNWVTHSKEDFMGDTIIITSLVTDFESQHRTQNERERKITIFLRQICCFWSNLGLDPKGSAFDGVSSLCSLYTVNPL